MTDELKSEDIFIAFEFGRRRALRQLQTEMRAANLGDLDKHLDKCIDEIENELFEKGFERLEHFILKHRDRVSP